MLPIIHRQRYQELKQAMEQLQQTAQKGTQRAKTGLRQQAQEVQQFFQQRIVTLVGDELDPKEDEARVRSYQTEMSKQLRLLVMDVTFLQAARQPETTQKRQLQLLGRIQTLIGYCDALMNHPAGENDIPPGTVRSANLIE